MYIDTDVENRCVDLVEGGAGREDELGDWD